LDVAYKERTLLAANATVSINRDGKVAERAGEPEDLPCQFAVALRATETAQSKQGPSKLGAALQAIIA